jgi:hypothetical protein
VLWLRRWYTWCLLSAETATRTPTSVVCVDGCCCLLLLSSSLRLSSSARSQSAVVCRVCCSVCTITRSTTCFNSSGDCVCTRACGRWWRRSRAPCPTTCHSDSLVWLLLLLLYAVMSRRVLHRCRCRCAPRATCASARVVCVTATVRHCLMCIVPSSPLCVCGRVDVSVCALCHRRRCVCTCVREWSATLQVSLSECVTACARRCRGVLYVVSLVTSRSTCSRTCMGQIPVPLPYRHVTAVVSGTCVALEAAVSVGVVRGGRSRGSVAVEHRAGVRVRGDVLADCGGVDAGVTLSLPSRRPLHWHTGLSCVCHVSDCLCLCRGTHEVV